MVVITFTFEDGSAIATTEIINKSLNITESRCKDLKSTSSYASFTLKASALYEDDELTTLGKLLTAKGNVLTSIVQDSTVLFTGLLSKKSNLLIRNTGVQDVTFNVDDLSVTLLKVPMTNKTYAAETVTRVVQDAVSLTTIEWNEDNPDIEDQIYLLTTPDMNADEFLADLLFEYGYCYYINNYGKFTITPINLDSDAESSVTFASRPSTGEAGLWSRSGEAISMRSKAGSYTQARVSYDTVEPRENVMIYKVENIQVPGGKYWDGTLHTPTTSGLPTIQESSQTKSADLVRNFVYYPVTATQETCGHVCKVSWELKPQAYPIGTCSFKAGFVYYDGTPDSRAKIWQAVNASNFYNYDCGYHAFTSDWQSFTYDFVITSNQVPTHFVVMMGSLLTLQVKNVKIEFYSSGSGVQSGQVVNITKDLEEGKKIWAMTNVTSDCEPSLNTTYDRLRQTPGTNNLEVLINCTPSARSDHGTTYDRFAARAKVWTTKENNSITSSKSTIMGSGSTYQYECKYCTDASVAQSLASKLASYYTYCNNTYTFFSDYSVDAGSVVTLKDNLYSGLEIKLYITDKAYRIGSDIIQYTGYALSDIGYVILDRSSTNSDISRAAQRFRMKGVWDPEVGYESNERYIDAVTYNGSMYVAKANSIGRNPATESDYWELAASAGAQGPQGEKGDKGDKGDTGAKGDKGDQGIQGVQGEKGDTGDTGAQGLSEITLMTSYHDKKNNVDNWAGLASDVYSKSQITSDYSKVKVGDLVWFVCSCDESSSPYYNKHGSVPRLITSISSTAFATATAGLSTEWEPLDGAKGDKGDTGAKGDKGDQGIQGVKGDTGAKGDKGDTGAKGDQGIQGPQGLKGDDGSDGKNGDYTEYQFARNDSSTTAPTTGWSDVPPTSGGQFLWCRERRVTY